jgi:hypothetical protein
MAAQPPSPSPISFGSLFFVFLVSLPLLYCLSRTAAVAVGSCGVAGGGEVVAPPEPQPLPLGLFLFILFFSPSPCSHNRVRHPKKTEQRRPRVAARGSGEAAPPWCLSPARACGRSRARHRRGEPRWCTLHLHAVQERRRAHSSTVRFCFPPSAVF